MSKILALQEGKFNLLILVTVGCVNAILDETQKSEKKKNKSILDAMSCKVV